MSDVVWQAIIAAVVTIVLAWMNNRTKNAAVAAANNAVAAADNAAAKVETVRTDATTAAAIVVQKVAEVEGVVVRTAQTADEHREEIRTTLVKTNADTAEKMGVLADMVQEVHTLTNGMKTELVAEVRAASLAKGALDQKAKDAADASHKGNSTGEDHIG